MKKISLIGVAFLFIFFMPANVYAQSEVKKIGFLDLSKMFDNYEKTKEYDKVLEKEHAAYEADRNAKIEKLKEKQGKLALLKEEEKEKMQKEIEDLRNALRQFDKDQQVELTKKRDEKIREILLEIEKFVSEYAKKDKFDMILNDRVLIYGNETMDITDQVLKGLNESYNKE